MLKTLKCRNIILWSPTVLFHHIYTYTFPSVWYILIFSDIHVYRHSQMCFLLFSVYLVPFSSPSSALQYRLVCSVVLLPLSVMSFFASHKRKLNVISHVMDYRRHVVCRPYPPSPLLPPPPPHARQYEVHTSCGSIDTAQQGFLALEYCWC